MADDFPDDLFFDNPTPIQSPERGERETEITLADELPDDLFSDNPTPIQSPERGERERETEITLADELPDDLFLDNPTTIQSPERGERERETERTRMADDSPCIELPEGSGYGDNGTDDDSNGDDWNHYSGNDDDGNWSDDLASYFTKNTRLSPVFTQTYRCLPATLIKPEVESGDKIILPPSSLDRLMRLEVDFPLQFSLSSIYTGNQITHCGVLEFCAEEGFAVLPQWMMDGMKFEEGDLIQVKNATLPKCTFVKLQPHSSEFLHITNTKAVMETLMRPFSCLTTGGMFSMVFNGKKFVFDVLETRPETAVSIVDVDCEVDFAPPLDYKEPELKWVEGGNGLGRKNGKVVFGSRNSGGKEEEKEEKEEKEREKKEETKFVPFTGKKYSLRD